MQANTLRNMNCLALISIAVSAVYLVLQASGDVCPRYPSRSCHGSFTIRPSSPTATANTHAQYCSRADEAAMESCLMQCMGDLCCRAFGVEHGNCTIVNFHTEAYDFVKEAHTWPILSEVCLNESETGCRKTFGSRGDVDVTAFSLKQPFIEAASDLKAINGVVYSNLLVKLEMDYGNSYIDSHSVKADTDGMNSFRCELAPGEYITEVTAYVSTGYSIIRGLVFKTSEKTCGPYGDIIDEKHTVAGHMLLYVEGYAGFGFNMLSFTFQKC